MELRILDLNVWHGLYARSWHRALALETDEARARRTQAIIEGIRALDVHVVALQECYPQPAFGERIAQALGLEHVSQVSNAGVRIFGAGYPFGIDTGEGSTILARPGLGLRSLGRIALSGYGYTGRRVSFQWIDKRMALACAIEVDGKPLHVVTFHVRYDWATFDMFEKAWAALVSRGVAEGAVPEKLVNAVRANMVRRDGEIEVLASWIEKLQQGAPVVLVGDLNIDDDAPQLRAFAERLKVTSTLQLVKDERPTWDPHNNSNIAPSASFEYPDGTRKSLPDLIGAYHDQLLQRPDHAFVSNSLAPKVLHAQVVLDRSIGGVLGSDHYGILTTLQV